MTALRCGDCGKPMFLRQEGSRKVWRCVDNPFCTGMVGAHPNGEPVGVPVDRRTRQLRIDVHRALDAIWDYDHKPTRQACYRWLAHMSVGHVASMNGEECRRVLEFLRQWDGGRTMTQTEALQVAQYLYGRDGHAEHDPFTEEYRVGLLLPVVGSEQSVGRQTHRMIVSGRGATWEGAFNDAGHNAGDALSRLRATA